MAEKYSDIICPDTMSTDFDTYNFLLEQAKKVRDSKSAIIYVWNFSDTTKLETSILAFLASLFEELRKRDKGIVVRIKGKLFINFDYSILELYNYYTNDNRAFFKVRHIGKSYKDDTENIQTKYIKNLKLVENERVKLLISELIANINMHTKQHSGIISAYNKRNTELVITITNSDVTIAENINKHLPLKLKSDYEAIMWALKKTNSTDNSNRSGGLGLYLLRKLINLLNGRFSILSGKCYLLFDGSSYDETDEDKINYIEYKQLSNSYSGNVFDLYLPYTVGDSVEQTSAIRDVDLLKL